MTAALSNKSRRLIDCCSFFLQGLLPQRCLLCAAPAPQRPLCDACRADLPRLPDAHCPQCATPGPQGGELCGACIAAPPAFSSVAAPYAYAWPLAELVQQFKYAGNLALTRLLADALCGAVDATRADLIVPMPLAPARLRARGFNQALELARRASRATGVALAAMACRRVADGVPQAQLPWRERAKNVRGAFVCDLPLDGLRVAVVDDVLTTGASLDELARTLRKCGAREVHGWVIARTLKRARGQAGAATEADGWRLL